MWEHSDPECWQESYCCLPRVAGKLLSLTWTSWPICTWTLPWHSSPYATGISWCMSTGFRSLAVKNLMTESTSSLVYVCNVIAIKTCHFLGQLLQRSVAICIQVPLTLMLTNTTIGFMSVLSEIFVAFSNFYWINPGIMPFFVLQDGFEAGRR